MGANLAGWRAPSRGELGAFRHNMPLIPAQAGIRAANAVRFWRRDTRRWRAWPGPRLRRGRGSRDIPHVVVLHLLCALCVVTPVFWFLPFQRRKLRRLGGRGVTQSEGARGAHSSGSSWCAPGLGGLASARASGGCVWPVVPAGRRWTHMRPARRVVRPPFALPARLVRTAPSWERDEMIMRAFQRWGIGGNLSDRRAELAQGCPERAEQ